MALFYITGVPGTGKSTVQKELEQRGYVAYDIDQPRFGGPVNLATGERTVIPPIEERSDEWFDQHEWRVSRPAIEELKFEAQENNVYLCGTTTTENLVWDLFDKVLYLNVTEAILKHRIQNRAGNDFGKTPDELQRIMDRYKDAQEKLGSLGAVIIDATGSLDEVVEEVIASSS